MAVACSSECHLNDRMKSGSQFSPSVQTGWPGAGWLPWSSAASPVSAWELPLQQEAAAMSAAAMGAAFLGERQEDPHEIATWPVLPLPKAWPWASSAGSAAKVGCTGDTHSHSAFP